MSEHSDIQQNIENAEYAATAGKGDAVIHVYNYTYNYQNPKDQLVDSDQVDSKDNIPCLYRGLFSFSPNDSEFFFGRDVFIEQLYTATKTNNFIPVLGASGSGKSSVVLAGLVPKLEQVGNWKFTHFRPGDEPFHALATALLPLYQPELNATEQLKQSRQLAEYFIEGSVLLKDVFAQIEHNYPQDRVLLIADQFEELFTLCPNEEVRQCWLDLLLTCFPSTPQNLQRPPILVATMRTDFLGNALAYRPLADILNADIKLGAMNREELLEVIEKPAALLGVKFEPGLADRILADVNNEPGNLALLEFALTELWQERTRNQLTHQAYKAIGGVKDALTKYADDKYQTLTEREQERARCIFIQLVHPGEGTEDTKRRANYEELGEESWNLIIGKDGLADNRLVITNLNNNEEKIVEIVHEALILNWKQLREWIERDREFRIWQERLKVTIRRYKEDKENLLSKTSLKIAEDYLQKREQEISQEEKDFICKSLKEQEKQLKNQKRLWWSGRILFTLSSIGLSILGTLVYQSKYCDVGEKVGQDCFRFIITSGDSRLFVGTTNKRLQYGIDSFAQKKFEEAEKAFKNAQNSARYDPIPLIYYNNAKALLRGTPYKLAVVVPVDAHEEIARNMLRGVASAQDKFNNQRVNSKTPLLEIIIANDQNHEEIAKKIAKRLITKDVLGIIGHRSSGSSLAALSIYEEKGMAMVSPTSGSTELDKYNVFFRAVASNQEFAKDIYEYAKDKCFNENKDNKVWLIYDSNAEYSKNLKKKFDQYRGKSNLSFDEFPLDGLPKDEKRLKDRIKGKINEKVKCAILMPSTKTTSDAISVVYVQSQLKLPREKKMQFLSGLTLHNDETLKKDGSSFGEDLKIVVPIPLLDNKTILAAMQNRWKKNINWRTYTSYQATLSFIEGLEKLDLQNTDNKNTIRNQRQIVLDYLKLKQSSLDKNPESCLMDFQDIQENYYDPSHCINIE